MGRPMALSLNQLPIVRHATFGVPWTVSVPLGLMLFVLYDGVPAMMARDAHDAVDLLRQGALAHLVLCIGAALAVSFASRRGTLTIDRDGIAVDSGHDLQFYAWRNLVAARPAGRGEVDLELRGVDLDDTASTTIPRAYGIKVPEWETLVADGVGRFGRAEPRLGRATVAGCGALAARWTWLAGARVLVGVLLAVALSSFAGNYARNRAMIDLAANGVATTGTVIGSYGEACTKRGCERWLAYRFTTKAPKTVVIGHDRLNLPGYVGPEGVLAKGKVPVIYDPADPSRSLIASADTVAAHGDASLRFAGAMTSVMAMMLAALLAVPAIATLSTPFDQGTRRRLLG